MMCIWRAWPPSSCSNQIRNALAVLYAVYSASLEDTPTSATILDMNLTPHFLGPLFGRTRRRLHNYVPTQSENAVFECFWI